MSNTSNVFNCPSCSNTFTSSLFIPFSLPCGHVICKPCLIKSTSSPSITCPLDHSVHLCSLVQKCKAILEYLPKEKVFVCRKHTNKRIKYICEYDNEFFCSICLNEHAKAPHKAHVFEPKRSLIESEVEMIAKRIEENKEKMKEEINRLNICRGKVTERTRDEIKKVNDEIDKVIISLNEIKIIFEEKIRNVYKYQIENIDEGKLSISKMNNALDTLSSMITTFNSSYQNKYNIIYENAIEDKNNIIYQWEQYIKTSSSSLAEQIVNSVTIPKLHYYTENVTKNLIKFDIENYIKKTKEDSLDVFRTESTKENSSGKRTKMAMRKGSDPTSKRFMFEIKGEDKPVLINNRKIQSPYVEKKKEDSNRRSVHNERKSVSLKYRDNILMTN